MAPQNRSKSDPIYQPIAQNIGDIEQVLHAFLTESLRRRENLIQPPYQLIMLIIDEVGSLTQYVDQEDETAVNVARMIQKIAAICGNKARGFNTRGIFISQRAAGLSWLRNAALMVIAHQTLMMNERLLVCKNNRAIADNMSTWPKGRTLVYGIAFDDILGGQVLVQQPFISRIVDANPSAGLEDLQPNPFPRNRDSGNSAETVETVLQADGDISGNAFTVSGNVGDDAEKSLDTSVVRNDKRATIRKLAEKVPLREVADAVNLSGWNYKLFQAVCREIGIGKE